MIWAFINGIFGTASCALAFKFAVEGNVSLTIFLCTSTIMFKMNIDRKLKEDTE